MSQSSYNKPNKKLKNKHTFELRIYDTFGTRVCFTQPDEMARKRIDFRCKGWAVEVNVLNLRKFFLIDLFINK